MKTKKSAKKKSSATELLLYLECRFCSQKVRVSTIGGADGPPLRTLHRAEDIGSALKRGVNVCQR